MIKVYKYFDTIVTVVITTKTKEVTVASSATGVQYYSAPVAEKEYGSMGSYIDSWIKTVEGLEPVVMY